MTKNIKIIALASLSFVSLAAVTASTIAWFGSGGNINFGTDTDNVNLSGGSVASYYESGTGTEQNPFIISNRNHVYNLAWLQYIGYYNDPLRNGGEGIQQKYFKIKNDIDLSGLAIPPIGTEIYPFLGNFDGNNCTLSNFVISNDDPTQDNSDFGVAKPANFYNGEQPEIVGFFGVVGKLPNQNITYTSSIVDIYNITLKDFTVKSETSQTLIGLAAGYVDGTMSGVRIDGSASLDIDGQTRTAKASITENLSDYGLVGYTTKVGSTGTYSQNLSEYYSVGGDSIDPTWGGSLNVKNYNHWFNYLNANRGYDGSSAMSTSANTVTGTGYVGKFTASYTIDPEIDYYYFRNAATYTVSLNSNGTGTLVYNNTSYPIISWSDSSSGNVYGFRLDFASSININGVSQSTFYLNRVNSSTSANFGIYRQAGHTSTSVSSTGLVVNRQFTFQKDIVYRCQTGTYLPLKYDSETWTDQNSNTVSNGNTGYVIGATGSSASNGAVKVSSYALSNIINSLSDTPYEMINVCHGHGMKNLSFNDSTAEILTYKEGTGWVLIKDSHNENHTVTNTKLSSYTKSDATTPEVLFRDAKKYNKSRDKLNAEILSGAKRVHAIHFDTPASGYGINGNNNIASYSNAKINGTTYASYQMPAGTIDFNLQDSGIINFFAGAYNSSVVDMSFFSLYKVNRNNNKTISSIQEIRRIYDNPNYNGSNDKYLFSYDENVPSGATADGLVKNLDNSLRINAVPVKNALYYFELPVNAGEYCMAICSNSSNQGAYMMYLDIGTSGDDTDSAKAYSITTKRTGYSYPVGVDFIPVAVAGNGGESMGVYIPSSSSGLLTFDVTSTVIDITDSSSIATFAFEGSKLSDESFSLTGDSPGEAAILAAGGIRVLSVELNTTHGDTFIIKITDSLTDDYGSFNESNSIYEVDSGSGFTISSRAAVEALSPNAIDLSVFRGLNIAASLTRNAGSTSEFITTYDTANCSYADKIVDVDIETNGATMSVSITTGYTFKIGGVTMSNNATYPSS